jgi:methyl-accepting chemotaxis protein
MAEAAGRQREAVDMVSTAFHEMVATANEVARFAARPPSRPTAASARPAKASNRSTPQ